MDRPVPARRQSLSPYGAAASCTTEQTLLGEGARWDARRAELLRVDILAGRIYRDRVAADGGLRAVRTYRVPGTVGAVAPIDGDDGWLLAAGRGFAHLDPEGAVQFIEQVALPGTRMNDGACDPQGRFWAGTLADDHRPGGGALHRLDRDGHCSVVLTGLTIPNGIDWSPDGTTVYLVDSGPRTVDAFTFDPVRGEISQRRTLLVLPEDVGAPDGMTVDASGDLWIAVYGGGQVRRYTPSGDLVHVLTVQPEQTTSCAFGGPTMRQLYVTTATEAWSDDQRRADPSAGLVYRFTTDAIGRPAAMFRPDPTWWRQVRST